MKFSTPGNSTSSIVQKESQIKQHTQADTSLSVASNDELQSLQDTVRQGQDQTKAMIGEFSSIIQELAETTNTRFEQQHMISTVRSQACMLGMQEIAKKLNIKIPSSGELLAQAADITKNEIRQRNGNRVMSASQQGSLTPVPKSIGLTDSEFSLTQASTLTFSQNQFTQDTTVSNESPMEVTQDSEQVIEEGDYSRIQINDKRMH